MFGSQAAVWLQTLVVICCSYGGTGFLFQGPVAATAPGLQDARAYQDFAQPPESTSRGQVCSMRRQANNDQAGPDSMESTADKGAATHRVELRMYDIGGQMTPLISTLLRKQMDHIWHVGVAVYDKEYWFSTHIEQRDLAEVEFAFGMAPIHVFPLGETTRTKEQFERYLDDTLEADYNVDKYDVFQHNCNHFADDVSRYLTGSGVPQHVLDMSEKALSEYGRFQAGMTKTVSNKLARYVMVAWGRANRAKDDKPSPVTPAVTVGKM